MRSPTLVGGVIAALAVGAAILWWLPGEGRQVGRDPAAAAPGASGPGVVPTMRMRSGDGGPAEAPALVVEPAAPRDAGSVSAPGQGPSAGGQPPASDALPTAFAAERRTEAWAAPREQEIRERLGGLIDEAVRRGSLPVAVGEIECRYRICQVPLGGSDERGLARVIDWMGDERGFLNLALDMHVTRREGGMTVYLRYGR